MECLIINKTQKETLFTLQLIMEKYPSLRLCQILGNCFETNDLYYKTDEEVLEGLKSYYVL